MLLCNTCTAYHWKFDTHWPRCYGTGRIAAKTANSFSDTAGDVTKLYLKVVFLVYGRVLVEASVVS